MSYLNVQESIWRELILRGIENPVLSSIKSQSPLWETAGYLKQ